MSTSEAKPSPGNYEDSGGEAAVSSAGAVRTGSAPLAVVDLNGLRVASAPLPGCALHESLRGELGPHRPRLVLQRGAKH